MTILVVVETEPLEMYLFAATSSQIEMLADPDRNMEVILAMLADKEPITPPYYIVEAERVYLI